MFSTKASVTEFVPTSKIVSIYFARRKNFKIIRVNIFNVGLFRVYLFNADLCEQKRKVPLEVNTRCRTFVLVRTI